MNSRVQSGLTAGVAIVGASAMAITPIATQTIQPPRVLEAATTLTTAVYGMDQGELAAEFVTRVSEQAAQLPFVPLVAALDVAGGDTTRLYTAIRSIIDAPLYLADPIIYGAALTLPESLGGNPTDPQASDIWTDFRIGQLYALRQELHVPFAEALGVDDPQDTDANYAWDLAQGVRDSAVRTVEGAALGVVGLGSIAQAVASGEPADLYKAIRDYIDAPLWSADPAIKGLAKALPESLGGNTDAGGAGALMHFRDTNLYGARSQVRVAVAKVLGVDNVDEHGDLPGDPGYQPPSARSGVSTFSISAAQDSATQGTAKKPDLAKLKPHATSLSAALNKAHDRAEKRAEKAKERRVEAAKNVQQAVKNLAKKLSPKKASVKKADKSNND